MCFFLNFLSGPDTLFSGWYKKLSKCQSVLPRARGNRRSSCLQIPDFCSTGFLHCKYYQQFTYNLTESSPPKTQCALIFFTIFVGVCFCTRQRLSYENQRDQWSADYNDHPEPVFARVQPEPVRGHHRRHPACGHVYPTGVRHRRRSTSEYTYRFPAGF